jgi:hypothetical protein
MSAESGPDIARRALVASGDTRDPALRAALRTGAHRPPENFMRKILAAALPFVLLACSPTPQPSSVAPAAPAAKPAAVAQPAFVDRLWRVESSSAVAPGTTYRFAADGSLHIQSPGSPPASGRWTYDGGKLVMIEEGIAYPTDILVLDARRLTIRSHNPGEPVDIAMVDADAPPPEAR